MIWWKAAFTDQELFWLRKAFRIQHGRSDIARPIRPNLLKWESSQGRIVPFIKVTLGEKYDTQASRDLARRRKRPALAPHGLFRELDHGNHFHAIEFLSKFGPLRVGDGDPELGSGSFWVSLQDFWAKHARFIAIADLWQRRDHGSLLREAWRRLYERLDEIHATGDEPFGSGVIVDWVRVFDRPREVEETVPEGEGMELPWHLGSSAFLDWLGSSTNKQLRARAMDAVRREFDLNASGRIQTWIYEGPGGGDRFVLALEGGDLWNAIWELFAQDTSGFGAWRVCPHCNKIFYPPRKDRLYCTPRLQQLASKREYARRSRPKAKG
jgi:hypothetical protein